MYNIPVALWILDTHPIHAPLCYVRPTPDMQIKVSQHVDGNGKIYLPYLHEWDAANSDILGLVQMCIITFGEQPPVFARPQNQPQQVKPVQDFFWELALKLNCYRQKLCYCFLPALNTYNVFSLNNVREY